MVSIVLFFYKSTTLFLIVRTTQIYYTDEHLCRRFWIQS